MSWSTAVFFVALAGTTAFALPEARFAEDVQRGEQRIVSGWEAETGQFPHQLSLRMVSNVGAVTACGASIIHNEWAITAAHCTALRVTVIVRAGVVNLTRPEYIIETTRYYNHPLYIDALASVVQPHDIALLNLQTFIPFSANIQPIRLQRAVDMDRDYADVRLVASGWGRTWTNGQSPENLNWVYLLGESNAMCRAVYGGSSIIVDSTICAGPYNVTSQSTCQGDSGGPLSVYEEDGLPTLIGIASFVSGTGCHTPVPAGFIRPGHYHDWYRQITGLDFDWVPAPPTTTTEAPTTVDVVPTTESETEAPTTTEAVETETPEVVETVAPTTTEAVETEAPTTEAAETEAPTTTEVVVTEAPTTTEAVEAETPEVVETEAPTTTEAVETEAPEVVETEAPTTTEAVETEVPEVVETEAPTTTEAVETEAPEVVETEAPTTTEAVETEAPEVVETEAPTTTEAVETEAPEVVETEAPTTTEAVETEVPEVVETEAPTTTEAVESTTAAASEEEDEDSSSSSSSYSSEEDDAESRSWFRWFK